MVFDKIWFKENQKILLFLCNNWILKYWFRWVLRIHKDVPYKTDIFSIAPNSYTLRIDLNTFKTDFRTHNKFAKRLYYAFKPYWYFRHYLDSFIKSFIPFEVELAYDTLTAYPEAGGGGGNTTCDGSVRMAYGAGAGVDWSVIISEAGNTVDYTQTTLTHRIIADTVSNKWRNNMRSISTFDTSSIGSGSTIDSATMSLYLSAKADTLSLSDYTVTIVDATPDDNNILVTTDYANLGTNLLTDSPIGYGDWNTGSYTDMVLNSYGEGYINKTGVTAIGSLNLEYDYNETAPTWSSAGGVYANPYSADQSGTSADPKLVVTYSTAAAAINKIIGII